MYNGICLYFAYIHILSLKQEHWYIHRLRELQKEMPCQIEMPTGGKLN